MAIKSNTPAFASVAVFFAAAIWGLFWIPLRYLEEIGLPGIWPALFINLPGAILMGLWLVIHWEDHRRHMARALMIGIFTGGLGFGLFAVAVLYGTVIRVTLLFYLTPIWGTLIGIVWLGDRATWARWLAIGTGLAGMALLLAGGTAVPLNLGDLFGFLSGIGWAVGGALIMRFGAVPVAASAFSQLFMGSLLILLCALVLATPLPAPSLLLPALSVGFGTAVVMIIPTMMVIFWAQKILFPGRLGLLMMAEVMLAVISASLLLPEEAMSGVEWIGAALIIGACLLEIFLTPAETHG
ncbi:DMT family transporter [Shimia sp. SDUM112013]|uniref:DMT family transporter n=1 Tax=Shimia sp. SDUM112013 TaxID=3136160 RepID=UPI0032EC61EA